MTMNTTIMKKFKLGEILLANSKRDLATRCLSVCVYIIVRMSGSSRKKEKNKKITGVTATREILGIFLRELSCLKKMFC